MRKAALVLGVSASLYVVVTLWLGRSMWGSAAASKLFSPRELPLVIGLVSTGAIIRAFRFYYFGQRLGWTVPLWPSIVVFAASLSLTATPGKAGELLKSALLRARYGTPVAQSAGVLIMERLGDLLALLCLASSGLLLFAGFKSYFFLSVVLVLSICVAPRAICYPLLQWSCRFGRFRPIAERLIRILHTINVLLRLEPLLIGLTLAVLAWGCEALAFNVLVQRVPVEIPFIASFAIVGLSAVVGALSMLPGGVGGVEAVMMLLLAKLGVDLPSATMIIIAFRLCTLYFGTLLGFCFLGLWKVMSPEAKPGLRSAQV
jgi:glycosyltransferase 2 family protein